MQNEVTLRRVSAALTNEEALELVKRRSRLTRDDVDHIVTKNEIGVKPDGKPLYAYVQGEIPHDCCAAAYSLAFSAANRRVAGGVRATAAGAFMEPRKRSDGSLGKRYEVPDMPHLEGAEEGVWGTLVKPDCHLTSFTVENWERRDEILRLAKRVDELYRELLPEQWTIQAAAARLIDPRFVIAPTVFTTITLNKNFPTSPHTDKANLRSGFGALSVLTGGTFHGCEFVFPRYRVALRPMMQDLLLFDSQEIHGNLPLEGKSGEFARISLVFYLIESLLWKSPRARPE